MEFSKIKLSAHESALLSEACYTNFDPGDDEILDAKDIEGGLNNKSFSKSQAKDFVTRWEVVYQEANTPSGFSATLFKSKNPNAAQPYVVNFMQRIASPKEQGFRGQSAYLECAAP